MRRAVCILAASAALGAAPAVALAQTGPPAAAPAATAPVVNFWYAGATLGASAVQNVNVIGGLEAGMRVDHNLDGFVEVGYARDVVTRRLDSKAQTIAAWLQQTQGQTAAGTVTVPATLGAIGVRYVLENHHLWADLRPYAVVAVGLARISYQPRFTLGGADVTPSLPAYGVTLGSDLRTTETKGTIGGGFGVIVPFGKLYFDGSYRLTSIRASAQAINLSRLQFGVGYRF